MANLTTSQLDKLVAAFEERAIGIQKAYMRKIGEHIRNIGQMLPSDVNVLTEMRTLDRNLNEIRTMLIQASGYNSTQIDALFYQLALSNYEFATQLLGISDPPPIWQNAELMQAVQAQARVTKGTMRNLSQTTIESTLYRRSVDTAVQAVQMGTTDYNSAVRMAATKVAQQGLVVTYPTGVKRRLDTAVRQNVLDGTRALNQAVLDMVGEQFGADGVEITAHAMCAEDHLPYQGRQYSLEEFQQLQDDLEAGVKGKGRPIGMWNCRHVARPIILGISKPAYTEEQLQDYARNSNALITIGNKTLTRYQWTQEQRKIETEIRRQRDSIELAKAQGDDVAVKTANQNIKALEDHYVAISSAAGLETQFIRTLSRTR